jgi:hypothetical protein
MNKKNYRGKYIAGYSLIINSVGICRRLSAFVRVGFKNKKDGIDPPLM